MVFGVVLAGEDVCHVSGVPGGVWGGRNSKQEGEKLNKIIPGPGGGVEVGGARIW